jgi:phage N-6-adenine-methyltransferase
VNPQLEALAVTSRRADLERYDPEHGLKSIAVAEAAEKYFRRAKDATRLFEAVELKLGEQRKFVLWWDQQEKQQGARGVGKKVALPVHDATPIAGRDGLPDRDTIHRWRRLKDEKKFEATLKAAQERCRRVCEAERGSTEQRGSSGTGENEWHTPEEYLAAARDVLGEFDLDPASTALAQQAVRATRYFTKETDGLQQPWHGRVWLNPPYAQPFIASFVLKLVTEVRAGRVTAAILLTHNYTDTAWFHEAASACAAICFTRGRVRFVSPSGELAAPTQGQAFFYFGPEPERFAERFAAVGFVVAPAGLETLRRRGEGITTIPQVSQDQAEGHAVEPVDRAQLGILRRTYTVVEAVEAGRLTLHAAEQIVMAVPREEQAAAANQVIATARPGARQTPARVLGRAKVRASPRRALALRVERGLEQLENALETLEQFLAEPGEAHRPQWVKRLEAERRNLSRLIQGERRGLTMAARTAPPPDPAAVVLSNMRHAGEGAVNRRAQADETHEQIAADYAELEMAT